MRFPRRSGPLIGILAGAFLGYLAASEETVPLSMSILGGAVYGGLAGCLLLFLDPKRATVAIEGSPGHQANKNSQPSSFTGRLLALCGLLFCVVVPIGFGLSLAAVIVNRKTDDSALVVSKIGLALNILLCLALFIVLIFGWQPFKGH